MFSIDRVRTMTVERNNGIPLIIGIAIIIIIVGVIYNIGKSNGKKVHISPYGGSTVDQLKMTDASPRSLGRTGKQDGGDYSFRDHPVLDYQRHTSLDRHPANWGDPIRPNLSPTGPRGRGQGQHNYYESGELASGSRYAYGYGPGIPGPIPGMPMNVPVPRGSLKKTNEGYSYPFYYQQKPLAPYDYFKPYGPNQDGMQNDIVVSDIPFYDRGDTVAATPRNLGRLVDGPRGRPPMGQRRGPPLPPTRFFGSVDAYHPAPEINTAWEKIGMVQTVDRDDNTIMNLYRRSIAPLQDLFDYSVQDKDGFIIPLRHISLLEDGDIIKRIQGKESLGPWRANIYVGDKWVWA